MLLCLCVCVCNVHCVGIVQWFQSESRARLTNILLSKIISCVCSVDYVSWASAFSATNTYSWAWALTSFGSHLLFNMGRGCNAECLQVSPIISHGNYQKHTKPIHHFFVCCCSSRLTRLLNSMLSHETFHWINIPYEQKIQNFRSTYRESRATTINCMCSVLVNSRSFYLFASPPN